MGILFIKTCSADQKIDEINSLIIFCFCIITFIITLSHYFYHNQTYWVMIKYFIPYRVLKKYAKSGDFNVFP